MAKKKTTARSKTKSKAKTKKAGAKSRRAVAKSKRRTARPKAAKRKTAGTKAARPKTAKRKTAGAKAARPKAAKRKTAGAKTPAKPKAAVPTVPSITRLPEMEVETTDGPLRLSDLKGRNVVLYFYPKDDTPGCTAEGCEIRDHYDAFRRHDAVAYGVSRDGIASHERFKSKYGFPFELIADPDEKLCRAFGVMQQKSLYGRNYMGVDRSTFIFDKAGMLRKAFRGVKVPGHIDQVLEELARL